MTKVQRAEKTGLRLPKGYGHAEKMAKIEIPPDQTRRLPPPQDDDGINAGRRCPSRCGADGQP
jgi:hypothetical protein